jgi:hypothetical protein
MAEISFTPPEVKNREEPIRLKASLSTGSDPKRRYDKIWASVGTAGRKRWSGRAVLRAAERRIRATGPGLEMRESAEFLRIDHGIEAQKKRLRAIGAFLYFSILAVTYVPASLPTQYHRPGEA